MEDKTRTTFLTSVSILLVGVLVAGSPVAAQTLEAGIDIFETPNSSTSTAVNFPFDFFCPGSSAFTASIALRGAPLATAPGNIAGRTDTIVERLHDADISAGVAIIPIVIRAMRLVGTSSLSVFCPGFGNTVWAVSGCTCGVQPITNITVQLNDPTCGCGLFTGNLDVNVCLTFTEVSGIGLPNAGPIQQTISLGINNMPWCFQPAPGTVEVRQAFHADTTCDGVPNLALPCTTNFHPGAQCGLDCPSSEENCHENPGGEHLHCIEPPCNRITADDSGEVPTTEARGVGK